MALFMDFHEDLKLPAGAIAQIAEDTRQTRAGQFGVRQVELYHDPGGQVYCRPKGRTRTPSASTTPRSAWCLRGRAPGAQPDLTPLDRDIPAATADTEG